ncbi:hypothetical protein E2562_033790 [Oryza meyeriana var. granulata]|uniref:Uncharacterized protein n=1 Tax=Oryza meyeriana var. granulata TaxID=110450 RepID=A0A6G1C1K6_9ORYZ|nr:hypothetical protein E2562_033790 [Oryza meyeriana var. granulata]
MEYPKVTGASLLVKWCMDEDDLRFDNDIASTLIAPCLFHALARRHHPTCAAYVVCRPKPQAEELGRHSAPGLLHRHPEFCRPEPQASPNLF